jgi:hypothetical protein
VGKSAQRPESAGASPLLGADAELSTRQVRTNLIDTARRIGPVQVRRGPGRLRQDNNLPCPVSPDLGRQHAADLRRARFAETASSWSSHHVAGLGTNVQSSSANRAWRSHFSAVRRWTNHRAMTSLTAAVQLSAAR